jgi:aspartate/methionine/tyrosine aminotransferase
MTEIIVTDGANGALNNIMMGFLNPGDEIVYFEPCYPMYLDVFSLLDIVPKPVALDYSEGEWKFDSD